MSTARISGHLILALLCAPLLMGGACEKKTAEKPAGDNAAEALDRAADQKTVEPGKVDTSALPGIDVGKLDADKQKLFYTLLGSLNSPCGKAHSLRTSFTTDQSCKRAPFAVRYVLAMLEDEAAEATLREYYTSKYAPKGKVPKFDVSKAPHEGNVDAPIKIVEFYDYECPHCEHFKKEMDQVLGDKAGKVVTYFMQFPLEQRHPDSRSAAQALLAADLQGKFKPMHDKLFAETPKHTHEAVSGYAKELGLDSAKFEADYAAQSGHVTLDQKQGEEAGVDSTPYIFFNNQHYSGPPLARYLEMWIDEELAAK